MPRKFPGTIPSVPSPYRTSGCSYWQKLRQTTGPSRLYWMNRTEEMAPARHCGSSSPGMLHGPEGSEHGARENLSALRAAFPEEVNRNVRLLRPLLPNLQNGM